jgi:hypothetical protein
MDIVFLPKEATVIPQVEQKQPKGRARMYLSIPSADYPEGVSAPLTGNCYQESIEVAEMFEKWHTFLHLPEQYALIGVYFDLVYARWMFLIESENIPLPTPGGMLPELVPSYVVSQDATVFPPTRTITLTDLKLIR